MAAFTRRQYKGAAASTTTTNSLNTSDTSVTIASNTGWPSSAGVPFYVVIDPGTSAEEKCSATISGTTLTLTRAQDDTTASNHSSGATIYPVFTANDADEANELVSKLTTKGDLLVTDGSALNRLAVGTNDYALVADSTATNGVKWAVPTDTTKVPLSTVTTKGDLLAASASSTITRLAAGTNEYRLVADSSQTAGLKYVADTTNYAVGAKGDILVGTAADTVTNVAVGTNDYVLTADSAQASGVKWAAVPSPGLTLISTTTIGSGVSSVTVSDCFSATYDNYKIIVNGGAGSGDSNIGLTLGASATAYYSGGAIWQYPNTQTSRGDNNATSWTAAATMTANAISADITLLQPFAAARTSFNCWIMWNTSTTNNYGGLQAGFHNVATSYTSFTLTPASGTMTGGTIRVYGYRNS